MTSGLIEPRLVIEIDRGAAGPRATSRLPKATRAGATLISGPGTGKLTVWPEVFSGDGEPRMKSALRLVESPKAKFWNRASEVGWLAAGSAGAGGPAPSVRPAGKSPYDRQRLTVKLAGLAGLPRKQTLPEPGLSSGGMVMSARRPVRAVKSAVAMSTVLPPLGAAFGNLKTAV